jgi:nicotinamide riboside kinase
VAGLAQKVAVNAVALLGAESTGKSALALAMAESLRARGLDAVVVPEHLRHWCEAEGRTPRANEQAALAATQAAQEDAALQRHGWVLCDTSPLMTAIYSQYWFADTSLLPTSLARQRRYRLTLLCATDLPWAADGIQRDGPQVRDAIDLRLRQTLLEAGIAFSVVRGCGPDRLGQALAAFDAAVGAKTPSNFEHWCEFCDSPDCARAEHRQGLFRRLANSP